MGKEKLVMYQIAQTKVLPCVGQYRNGWQLTNEGSDVTNFIYPSTIHFLPGTPSTTTQYTLLQHKPIAAAATKKIRKL